ncbi:ABC transporter ATP-binding protein [Geomicrobium sp. JCM 19039]|uniref:ABC transporter ATP-binding protein n=1 Tax=Geomicrobium sp. JCM 19039 TaxID=1460636 RepID=UPI00045F3791|nr:ATP-binding cassette domain-containing protein [Geomicrobium sp. JCM 19039]GAK10740.1 ABC transporter ATP-binding protein [Geomicrobium sp. JCM 19039]
MELELDKVSHTYPDGTQGAKGVNWTIEKGACHCWIGRSGSGKSTLLKLASGLLMPSEGTVKRRGERVTGPVEKAGMVFQEATLLPWKTVLQNLYLPIQLHRSVEDYDKQRASDLLDRLNIADTERKYPHMLSGGQQSRVAIARALMTEPSLLFFDEPFASLDQMTTEELQHELLLLQQEKQLTVLFITHDLMEATYLADCIGIIHQAKSSITLNRHFVSIYMTIAEIHGCS